MKLETALVEGQVKKFQQPADFAFRVVHQAFVTQDKEAIGQGRLPVVEQVEVQGGSKRRGRAAELAAVTENQWLKWDLLAAAGMLDRAGSDLVLAFEASTAAVAEFLGSKDAPSSYEVIDILSKGLRGGAWICTLGRAPTRGQSRTRRGEGGVMWSRAITIGGGTGALTGAAIWGLRSLDPVLMYALMVAAIAFIYVRFALADGRRGVVVLDSAVALAFFWLATAALRIWPPLAGLDLVLHGLWDVAHHPRGVSPGP